MRSEIGIPKCWQLRITLNLYTLISKFIIQLINKIKEISVPQIIIIPSYTEIQMNITLITYGSSVVALINCYS